MFRTTILPMRDIQIKPAFWGIDRDLKKVIDNMESAWVGNTTASPTTDFKETNHAYFMSIDMPGVNKKNLELQIEEGSISIKANRERAFASGEENKQEISRMIQLPKEVNKEKVQAHCEDGVLYLVFPKIEKEKPKKIEVSEGLKDATWSGLLSDKNQIKNDAVS